jgi:glycosyltransferase involved in cell wall biosynthesis
MSKINKICFVSLYSYPLFNPDCKGQFGGSEVRTSIIVKGLARTARYDISLIVFDHGQPDVELLNGITIYAWKGRRDPSLLQLMIKDEMIVDSPGTASEESESNNPNEVDHPTSISHATDNEYVPDTIIGRLKSLVVRKFKSRTPPDLWMVGKRVYRIIKTPFQLLFLLAQLIRRIIQLLFLFPKVVQRVTWRIDRAKYLYEQQYNRTFLEFGSIGNHSILRKNISIYDKVNADIYVIHGNSELTADLIYFCKSRGKKFIFLAGSDMDYDPDYKASPDKLNRYSVPHFLMAYAIQEADVHCVQNEKQAQILSDHYHRESILIKNPINLKNRLQPTASKSDVLWVGKSDTIKRPEIVIELAKRLPHLRFTLIMTLSNREIHSNVTNEARNLSNVIIHEFIPYNEIESYFAAHRILVNTSILEGFPNTFLQAAKYGLPIVTSRVDPGFILTKHRCGMCGEDDFEILVAATEALASNKDLYDQTRENCLRYMKSNHDEEVIIGKYSSLIDNLISASIRR